MSPARDERRQAVLIEIDGEIVKADGHTIGWVVRRRTGRLRLRRRWFGVALYPPRAWTEPQLGKVGAACALAKLGNGYAP